MNPSRTPYDAVVVGAGPNGLAAAVTLARAGRRVHVIEANDTVGGGARSAALTRPGFVHDLGSSIHPLGVASPFFRSLSLEDYGLEWVQPDVPVAHPLGGDRAAALYRSLAETAAGLGADGPAYRRLMQPLVDHWEAVMEETLRPLLHVPRHPITLARFGLRAVWPAQGLARALFRDEEARALFAGLAAHANLPLTAPASAAFGLMLGLLGHAVGWPLPRGGAQQIADALAAYLRALGGTIETGRRVTNVDELPPARAVLLDVAPRGLLRLAGHRLPSGYRRRLRRYRHGPAAFKIDYALSDPIPWTAAACRRAGTVHVGGPLEAVAAAEQAVAEGRAPEHPFLLLAQHSLFDSTRAPDGKHTAWTYGHVPNGFTGDLTAAVERQIERFAPGFRDCVIERYVSAPAELERQNANLVGGDIMGGAMDLGQLAARPVFSLSPYRTPARGLYLCSASTPPGGGVHGMGGVLAAQAVLHDVGRDS